MEVDHHEQGFLEELLSLRRETWETFPPQMSAANDEMMMLSNGWTFNCFNEMMITNVDQSLGCFVPNTSLFGDEFDTKSQLEYVSSFNETMNVPFGEDLSSCSFIMPEIGNFTFEQKLDAAPISTPLFIEQQDQIVVPSPSLSNDQPQKLIEDENDTKLKLLEQVHHQASTNNQIQVFEMGSERKNSKVKKVEGQPSKNLMAERRRRKRLNDRLSMLRSVVPKISKMDRTSILGDTIDYMKELLDRIKILRGEIPQMGGSTNNLSIDIIKDPKEILIRNTPKFEVERREMDTRVEISCAGKPGLLLSTITSIEALGLEIQHCVISCFSDFAMQASCSEELEQTKIISSDEMKQALFISAGYGGRFL